MGIRRGSISTPIIADGLTVNIDPANRASYPESGTSCFNTLDISNTGTLNGITFSDGKWDFDGGDAYINFGDFSKADFGYQVPFTFNVWFRLDNGKPLSTTSHLYTIFSKYQNNNVDGGYALFLRGGTNNGISFRSTSIPGTGTGLDLKPTSDMSSTFTDYEYHSATVTYNSSALASLYVDGQFINSNTLGTGQRHLNGMPFYIGVYSSLSFDFEGNIGPLQIYNRALSANEVLHNYNALKGRFGL